MIKTPAYVRVYTELKRQILESEYAIGQLLPAEPELEKLFQVSRTTVRKAVEILGREGYVAAKQGRGTQVLNYTTSQNLNEVTSISETLERRGFTVYAKSMYIDTVIASAKVASELGVPQNSTVVRVQRIQIADEKPIAIMKNYLKPELVPDLLRQANTFHRLYDYLEERYGIHIDTANDRITAKSASFTEAQMLDIPVGTALICLSRICYQKDVPVCVDHVSLIGGRYDFEIVMKGRAQK